MTGVDPIPPASNLDLRDDEFSFVYGGFRSTGLGDDFRSDGLERQQVEQWIAELGWEALVNKRSTTWKTLADSTKQQMNNQTAVDAILQAPTLIKRPLLDTQQQRSVGFKPSTYEALLLSPQ